MGLQRLVYVFLRFGLLFAHVYSVKQVVSSLYLDGHQFRLASVALAIFMFHDLVV